MDVKWTDVAQLGVSVIGFGLIIYQIWLLRRSTAGSTYASLYGEYSDVCKLFLEKPYLRAYFYNAEPVPTKAQGNEPILQEVETMCELVTGLLEHAALQKKNIPPNIWKECWEKYTYERFDRSPALAIFWKANKHWYAEDFKDILAARDGEENASPQSKSWLFKLGRAFARLGG
jgi:hypothetical protein